MTLMAEQDVSYFKTQKTEIKGQEAVREHEPLKNDGEVTDTLL